MSVQIEIKSATIIRGTGPDYISLETTLPQSMWPYKGEASVRLEVAAGGAEEYIAEHLPGLNYTVVDIYASRRYAKEGSGKGTEEG